MKKILKTTDPFHLQNLYYNSYKSNAKNFEYDNK